MKEWKDFYNNDYIIFSINNGIVNDSYLSSHNIYCYTHQSQVELHIDNAEEFSFKDFGNDTSEASIGNYSKQVLDVEENENKEKKNLEEENQDLINSQKFESSGKNDLENERHLSLNPINMNFISKDKNELQDYCENSNNEILKDEDFAASNENFEKNLEKNFEKEIESNPNINLNPNSNNLNDHNSYNLNANPTNPIISKLNPTQGLNPYFDNPDLQNQNLNHNQINFSELNENNSNMKMSNFNNNININENNNNLLNPLDDFYLKKKSNSAKIGSNMNLTEKEIKERDNDEKEISEFTSNYNQHQENLKLKEQLTPSVDQITRNLNLKSLKNKKKNEENSHINHNQINSNSKSETKSEKEKVEKTIDYNKLKIVTNSLDSKDEYYDNQMSEKINYKDLKDKLNTSDDKDLNSNPKNSEKNIEEKLNDNLGINLNEHLNDPNSLKEENNNNINNINNLDQINSKEKNFNEKKNEKYKKLLNSLKTEQEEKAYFMNKYQKNLKQKNENEQENLLISNSINSNNSQDFNNLNSDLNEIASFEKYSKNQSRALSFTTRSRDDEIKNLNDKLSSYKNQNKIILDENKKLLEIINIFKILQNLENSKKKNIDESKEPLNDNLEMESLDIDIEKSNNQIKNENIYTREKESSKDLTIKQQENNNKKFDYGENVENVFANLDLIHFEKKPLRKNEKKSIKNIDFTSASKFLNANKNEGNEINFPLNVQTNEGNDSEKNSDNFTINEIKEENFINNNNRYNNSINNENSNSLNVQNEIKNYENNNSSSRFGNLDSVNENNNERDSNINSNNKNPMNNEMNEILRNSGFNNNHNHNFEDNQNMENIINSKNKNEKINHNHQINVNNMNMSLSRINSSFSPESKNSIGKDTLNLNSNSTIGNNLNSNKNKKKTFIKINENNTNKGFYANKAYKPNVNITSSINNNNIKKGNKISYINTNTNNSNSAADTKINSNSIKSSNVSNITPQSEQYYAKQHNIPLPLGANNANNYKDLEKKKKFISNTNNKNNLLNYYDSNQQNNQNKTSSKLLNNIDDININNWLTNKGRDTFFDNLEMLEEKANGEDKDGKNYNNLIHYLEKYRDLNDRLMETLDGEKKIDLDKRKKDVEYLEHVLDYITNLGDNKESKDLIPFYLIDKRKLFENMVKYLYSKDEMIHSTKPKNVRLYKYHNKPK